VVSAAEARDVNCIVYRLCSRAIVGNVKAEARRLDLVLHLRGIAVKCVCSSGCFGRFAVLALSITLHC
jgi:hypothetical protein